MSDAAPRDGTYMPVTITTGIRAAALATPDKRALVEGDRALSYARLVERIDRVAHGLAAGLGLEPGDRIALMTPNCLEFVEIVCGAADAGLATAMVNPRLTMPEAAYICNDSGARVLFVDATLEDMMRAAALDSITTIIVIGRDYDAWRERSQPRQPRSVVDERATFAIPYTAGTTGHPKGVMLSHRSRVLTFFSMAVEYGCYGRDDRALAVAPLFHGAGFAFAVAPIFFGGHCEILVRFDPEQILARLADGAFTNTFMVPTHFNAIFALPEAVREARRFPQLRTLISNAAPLPQATKEKIVAYFGAGRLHECYGSTEGAIVSNLPPADQLRKVQCVGRPLPCTRIRLVDAAGAAVTTGEIGELYSRSPCLFSGYWGQPEATAAALRDGWFSAGDLARHDEEGYLYLVDRKHDLIISGGVNIYPRDIEEVLHAHPAVAEAAVVGVPDAYWGEHVKAFVVARGTLAAADLLAHCEGRLARYKLPREIDFVSALPRNAAGKVLRRELRAQGQRQPQGDRHR